MSKSCVEHGVSWSPGCMACDASRSYDPKLNVRDDTITPRPAGDKLRDAFALFVAQYAYDPRGGHVSVVARPEFVEQVLGELDTHGIVLNDGKADGDFELAPAFSITSGSHDSACIVFRFARVPVRVRHAAKPGLWVLPDGKVPEATREDRQAAGMIRIRAHQKKLIR